MKMHFNTFLSKGYRVVCLLLTTLSIAALNGNNHPKPLSANNFLVSAEWTSSFSSQLMCNADAGDLLPSAAVEICAGDNTPEFTADYVAGDENDPNPNMLATLGLSEIRIDQPGADDDEYVELAGPPGMSLDNYFLLVIGDGIGGDGTIENVTDFTGSNIPADGYFFVAMSSFSLGATPDLLATLNFENSDNVTFLLVEGFTGMNDDDLDIDDDGVLDVTPWTSIIDEVALVETPGSGDAIYSSITIGPDGTFVPGHVLKDGMMQWQIGAFDPVANADTPGTSNAAPPFAYVWLVTEDNTATGGTAYDIIQIMEGANSAPYGAVFSGLNPGTYCVHGLSFEGSFTTFTMMGYSEVGQIVDDINNSVVCGDIDPALCIPLTVVQSLIVSNIQESTCTMANPNGSYSVSFEISGGLAPVTINGEDISQGLSSGTISGAGTLANPYIFNSNMIVSNTAYNYVVADASALCTDPPVIAGQKNCDPCANFEAPSPIAAIEICEGTDAIITPAGGGMSMNTFTTELFISEYIEGSGNNKCVEIYNGTGAPVDLGSYDLELYFNGATTPGQTIGMSSILQHDEVFVICNSSADGVFLAEADLQTGSMTFNGDDAIILLNNGSIVDIFGNIGCDPGVQWSDGSNSTQNETLVRSASVTSGIATDPANSPCEFPTLVAEWSATGNDNAANLGQHSYDGMTSIPVSYNFYEGNNLLSSGASYTVEVPNVVPVDGLPHSIFVTAVSATPACESATTEVLVTVFPKPSANPIAASLGVCLGDGGVTVNGNPSGGAAPYTHSWEIVGGTATGVILNNATTQMVIADATNATAGTLQLSYAVTDANGCLSDTEIIDLQVVNCDAQILDPCTCLDNATNLDNGQFSETIELTAPSGQNWTVANATGFFDINSPNPPQNPLPLQLGVAFTEVPTGSGRYQLTGKHIEAQGYTLIAENELGQTLEIANTCYYPTPVIEDLEAPICLYTDPILLMGNAGGAVGTGTFTVNGQSDTIFSPLVLGIGTHIVTFTFDAGTATPFDLNDPGCVQSVSKSVQIVETPEALACNDNLNISLNENCEAPITADILLEGTYNCTDDYEVQIFHQFQMIPNPVLGDYIGKNLDGKVIHLPSGNSCWSHFKVEDKYAPILDCQDVTIECFQNPADVLPPFVYDNCDTFPQVNLVNEVIEDDDSCNGVTIFRTWVAIDNKDNVSDTCTQTIFINPPMPPSFPEDRVWSCIDFAAFPNITETTPYTGILETTGSGVPTNIGTQYCNYSMTFTDNILQDCGNSFRIVRTWIVMNWCTGQLVLQGAGGEDNVQVIEVVDETPPVISMNPFSVPANISGVHPQPCTSIGLLPPANISDVCNAYTSRIFTPVGEANYVNGTNGLSGGFIPSPGLALGTHIIKYIAEDVCGNINELEVAIEVIDNITPSAICDEITTISIPSDGGAEIFASVFDDGSFDNCCIDFFEVKKLADACGDLTNLEFGESVTFCCEEVSETSMEVEFRVVDCFGNFNTCNVQVIVQDKIQPQTIFCPPTQSVNCDFYQENLETALNLLNYNVLDQFGTPQFHENCELIQNQMVSVNLDQCIEGTITRTWTATDPSGNGPSTCMQTIQVQHVSDWVVAFPADITVTCTDEVPNFGEPEIFYANCELIATSYDDLTFNVVPDACFKIIRTWQIINWCVVGDDVDEEVQEVSESQLGLPFPLCDLDGDGDCDTRTFRDSWNGISFPDASGAGQNGAPDTDFDLDPWDGFIEYDQVIKVIDDTAPVLTCPADVSVCIEENICSASFNLQDALVEDCSDEITLEVTTPFGNGTGPFFNVNPGSYTATYTAIDNCSNVSTCSISITVSDCKLPTPYCDNGVIAVLMDTEPPMIEIWANDLNAGSFDNCIGDLEFSFSADVNDQSVVFGCDEIGQQLVQMWVTDASGNQDFCETFVIVQDNQGVCAPQPMVGGSISTEDNLSVGNVTVQLSGGLIPPVTTGTDGMFEFTNIEEGYDFSLIPNKDTLPLNGVTTFDLVLITKHVLNTEHLDSPYKIIAADANKSGTITTIDLVELRRLILHVNDNFTNNTSWRFIPADYEFTNPENPTGFPEVLTYNNIAADITNAHFIGIKVGDVNGSAFPNELLGSEDRNTFGELILNVENRAFKVGSELEIEFSAENLSEVLGWQGTINFDQEVLEFVEVVESDIVKKENFGLSLLEAGAVTASWLNVANQSLGRPEKAQESHFKLKFRTLANGEIKDVISLNSRYTQAEAYSQADELLNLKLAFLENNGKVFDKEELQLYQNHPNPFENTTTISFTLPETGHARLTIVNIAGTVSTIFDRYIEKGHHEIILDKTQLSGTGVYFYQLETTEKTIMKKMILK